MLKGAVLGLALLATPTLAQDKKTPPPAPAQEPDWAQVRKNATTLLTSELYDPQAAQLTWKGGWRWGHIKPFQLWSKREWGWLGCVALNGKNRMGGYVGATDMYVLLKPNGELKSGTIVDVTSECDDGSAPVPLQAAFMDTPGTAGTPSIADELAKLADLKAKGVLTNEEFAAQKAKLLAR